MANNPMLSSRQRLNSVSNAFSMDNLSQQNGAGSKRGKLLQKNLHGETVNNNTSNNPLGKSVIKRAGKSQVTFARQTKGVNGQDEAAIDAGSIQASHSQYKLEKFFT